MVKNLIAASTVLIVLGSAAGQPNPKQPADRMFVTKSYDIGALVGPRGKSAGLGETDSVIKLILETVPAGELKPSDDGPQIIEREGFKLEVRATAKVQEQIKDLIGALERLADVAIDVKVEVIEVNAGFWYDQNIKPLFQAGKGKPDLTVAAFPQLIEGLLEKNSRVVQSSSSRLTNGIETTISARHKVLNYQSDPNAVVVAAKPESNPQFVKEGFKLSGVPVVSADRRFVRFKLTEQSTALIGMKKRELGDVGGKPLVAQSPELEDLGASASAMVPDGGTIVFRLAHAPADKVWMVVMKPRILIRAEEEEIQRLKRLEEKVKRVFPVRKES